MQNQLNPDNNNILMKIMGGLSEDNVNFKSTTIPDVQAGFRKDRGTRDQIASIFPTTSIHLVVISFRSLLF